jgi:AmiR/NasT family two-component response regulator
MCKKILIVEDEGITSLELEKKLRKWGYKPLGTAISGEEAVRMARDLEPDLVIMDIRIQGEYDGVEVAEKIQSEMEVSLIYITAHSSDLIMNRAHKTSPYAYFIKPFSDTELKFAIDMAIYKHDMEQKLTESEKKYKSLMDNLMVGVFIMELDGNIVMLNQFLADLSGLGSLAEMIGSNAKPVFREPHERRSFLKRLKKVGKLLNETLMMVDNSDQDIEILVSAKIEDGLIYGVICPVNE